MNTPALPGSPPGEPRYKLIKSIPDATLEGYTRAGDGVAFTVMLWNDEATTIFAAGVEYLEHNGIYHIDGLVEVPALSDHRGTGFAFVDDEDNPGLRFIASSVSGELLEEGGG